MIRTSKLPVVFASLLGGALVTGCATEVPPRPPPPPEQQAQLPGWFPEKPWTEQSREETFYFGKVVFDTDKATIRPEAEDVLQKLHAHLKDNPQISRIRLEGHTDARAGEEYNQKLSEERALAIANWLVDNGLDHNRILAVAFGELQPLAPNDSAAGRQENRRTEFHVAEVRGNPFRGQNPSAGGMVLTVLSKEEREALKQQGEVPTYEPPEVEPEGDVIKPYPPPPRPGDEESGEDDIPDAPPSTGGDT